MRHPAKRELNTPDRPASTRGLKNTDAENRLFADVLRGCLPGQEPAEKGRVGLTGARREGRVGLAGARTDLQNEGAG